MVEIRSQPKLKMDERIIKDKIEFIIVPYAQEKRYCILVVKDNNIDPKFPFNSSDEAKKWINDYKGD